MISSSITRRVGVMSRKIFTILNILLILFSRDVICDDSLFVNFDCSHNNYTYTIGSTFQENLNYTLFSVLPANATTSRFSNFSIGAAIDRVYALYMCRGDIDARACHDCVKAATNTVVERCPLTKQGIVWYEECILRYANSTALFSPEEATLSRPDYNHSSTWSEHTLNPYRQKIETAMGELIEKVAHNFSLQGFSTTKINLSESGSWWWRGLAQCTPDILGSLCGKCLSSGFNRWDSSENWATTKIFLPSCLIRFDQYGNPPPPPPYQPDTDSSKIIRIVLPSTITIAVLLLLGGFYIWKNFCRTHQQSTKSEQQDQTPAEDDIAEPRTAGVKRFSYSEVEYMTKGFQRRVGEGGFGYVYYGCITDGRRNKEVAVKVLSKDAPKQFSTEIAVFGKISHKNLVSLIGYCEDPNVLALVYEYMAGGDLKSLLSGSDPLSWRTRLEMAIDSAQGLDYLHNGCRIVHRDVKTPNILLNQHRRAKIADFGFSKILPDDYVSVLSTRVIGTAGYLDPQYHLTGQLNEGSDVYSFGVVLLELITGKGAMVTSEKNLVQWVRPMLERGDLESIVDPRLPQVENRSSLWRAIDLAMECVRLNAVERPAMGQIVSELKECLAVEMDERSPIRVHPNSPEIMDLSVSAIMAPIAR